MKEKGAGFLKRYETIYGVLIGVIPSFMFQIFPSDTSVPFSWFLLAITALLIVNWFLFASRCHATAEVKGFKEKLADITNIKLGLFVKV